MTPETPETSIRRSAILPIDASHTELVDNEKRDKEVREIAKKLKRLA